jgi:hypothetical protein
MCPSGLLLPGIWRCYKQGRHERTSGFSLSLLRGNIESGGQHEQGSSNTDQLLLPVRPLALHRLLREAKTTIGFKHELQLSLILCMRKQSI